MPARALPACVLGAVTAEPREKSIPHTLQQQSGMTDMEVSIIDQGAWKEEVQPRAQPIALRMVTQYPVTRRPQLRPLSQTAIEDVRQWFESSGITIGPIAATDQQREAAQRLFYTWKDCFAVTMRDVKPTDLIHHSIDLIPNAIPVYHKIGKYTPAERAFAATIFPEMEEAGIIVRAASDWGARTRFPPKKKGSDKMRVVHNFIPVNKCTIKPQYPMHQLEEVLDTIVKPKFTTFFSTDASNGYWAVPIKPGDEYKAGVVTPHGQYVYRRMGQGLKGAPHTYSQFSDLVFGPIPKNDDQPRFPSLIGDHGTEAFALFMDDHMAGFTTYEAQFNFLMNHYFPRVAFGPVYLVGPKTHAFADSLEMVGFQGSAEGLRPSIKHRERIRNWPTPRTKDELDAFIYLTPFLRVFIPGRAEHVQRLKEAYLKEEEVPLTGAKSKGRKSVRKRWVETGTFVWTERQQESFDHIKMSLVEKAMTGADHDLEFHLATDASNRAIGGVLFQLHDVPIGTEALDRHKSNLRIIMFLSFRLSDVETRYTTTEREALAVVRCLAEVRWLVMGSKYPTHLYTDHKALTSILDKGIDAHNRIARWMDRLSEYDFKIHHRPNTASIMGIADGLSRMPGVYSQQHIVEDAERMVMCTQLQQRSTIVPVLATTAEDHHHGIREWEQYTVEEPYRKIVHYLTGGIPALKDQLQLGPNEIQSVIRQARKYRLKDGRLLYRERSGNYSKCALRSEVRQILAAAHDGHGHYAQAITLDHLVDQFYWPTRAKDVYQYCRTCDTCQQFGPRKRNAELRPIVRFQPMDLVGMDFFGPVKPACQATGAMYVLVVVDYFSRLVWTQAYASADQAAVFDMWTDRISPIFGWPYSIYTDNGTHFTGSEVEALFENRGVRHYKAPITHPSSVGLAERTVQLVVSQLRKWCREKGPAATRIWSKALPHVTLNINTRLVRTYGYSPTELMFGYNPKWQQDWATEPPLPSTVNTEVIPGTIYRAHLDQRDEIRELGLATAAAIQDRKTSNPQWTKPEVGNLVLVRRFRIEKAHGKKLHTQWTEPKLLVKIARNGVSAYVQDLHGSIGDKASMKKYHLDDIKVYHPRQAAAVKIWYDRTAMRDAGFPGQRAIFL